MNIYTCTMYMYYYTKPHVMSWYIYHCEHLYTYHVHLNALPHVYLVLTYNDCVYIYVYMYIYCTSTLHVNVYVHLYVDVHVHSV